MNLLDKLFQGSQLGKSFCSCAPSPPPPPDYRGAAMEQGQANIDAARVQSKMNNPNVVGPYGSQTVSWTGDQPTVYQKLAPDQQKILDTGNQAKIGLSELALQGTGLARDVLGNRFTLDNLPDRGASASGSRAQVLSELQGGVSAMPEKSEALRERIVGAMMGRTNEDAERSKRLLQSDLSARGIGSNTDAYRDAMALEQRKLTDARNQAYLSAGQEMSRDFGLDMARRQQGVSEYGQAANIGLQGSQLDSNNRRAALAETLTERQTPINEISALQSGSQVQNPFSTPGYAQNAQVQAAPLFAAQNMLSDYNTDIYNARAAQAGNLQQGLFGLGSAGIMGGFMASDRRLKSKVVPVGYHPIGVPLYAYDIAGRREVGVMADELAEVMPEAVVVGADGYQRVNYAMIGG